MKFSRRLEQREKSTSIEFNGMRTEPPAETPLGLFSMRLSKVPCVVVSLSYHAVGQKATYCVDVNID